MQYLLTFYPSIYHIFLIKIIRYIHATLRLDTVTCVGLPEHFDLIQRIEQEVPQQKKFSKNLIHLSTVVGQGMYHYLSTILLG